MENYKFVRLLVRAYQVFAVLSVVGGLASLAMADIDDKVVANGLGSWTRTPGIGFTGVMSILVATVVSFVVFMGLAQVMQLLLNLSASMDQASIRFGEISLALGELRADTKKTKEQVRLVGSLVYEEAKKEDG